MNGYALNHDKQIRKKRADYVLAVKGNQGTLLEDLKLYFGDESIQKEIRKNKSYSCSKEKAHGQVENREYYQTNDIQ